MIGMRNRGGPVSWKRCAAVSQAWIDRKEAKKRDWFDRRASEMRQNPTNLETKLELILDSLNINHKKQYVIGRFIVDFYLPAYRIAIEADGPRHETYKARKRDEKRDRILRTQNNCKVLHLRSHEFFSTQHLENRIREFVTGCKITNGGTPPAQGGLQERLTIVESRLNPVNPLAAQLSE